jgi:hypothetical protein
MAGDPWVRFAEGIGNLLGRCHRRLRLMAAHSSNDFACC